MGQAKPAPEAEYRYPDFLCIGAQKAGTTWVDRNLRHHPRLWLPPMKELQYFSELYVPKAHVWTSRQRRERGTQLLARYVKQNRKVREWDFPLVARLADLAAGKIGDGWYGRIFTLAPPGAICGEVTPDYSTLSDEGIAHVLRLSPGVRIMFSMRDPIARSWSHIRMNAHARGIEDDAELEVFAAHADQVKRANYPAIIANWLRFIPRDRLLTMFLDEIESAPDSVLERICAFLNVEYDAEYFPKADTQFHVGEERDMPPGVERILKRSLRPVYESIAELYPEIGRAWMARHY
jgi:hypothetical protein